MPTVRRSPALFAVIALLSSLLATLTPARAAGARAEAGPADVSPGLARVLESAPPTKQIGAFVHLTADAHAEAVLARHGLVVTDTFDSVDVVFAVGRAGAFRTLVDHPLVTYLQENRRLQYHGDTGPWATRARVAQTAAAGGPYFDGGGATLDGSGVGVAIVDSGIFALHPDLENRVAANYKVVCSTPGLINTQTQKCFGPSTVVEAEPDSDTTGGHGTHVAGIVAGDGTASEGTFKGVAPGATLYGFGTGEGINVFTAAEALQYIHDNYNSFNPRIRVINNSWGDDPGTAFDPNDVINKLTNQLVAKGVTFTWSAGNGGSGTTGSTGAADESSSYPKNPTPGVISTGNYFDSKSNPNAIDQMLATETGTPEGSMDFSSSRGRLGAFETYPDVAAPGAKIMSTCIPLKPVCDLSPAYEARGQTKWTPYYSSVSGTSMAAPHVAGVVALLLQANPSLTPAQVEDVLQDTARKFTSSYAPGVYQDDPQNPGGTISFDKGAGLVNVPAALNALGAERAGVSSDPVTITTDPSGDAPAGAADITGVTAAPGPDGVTYRIQVADVTDVPPGVSLRVTQNVNGLPFRTDVTVTPTGANPVASSTAPASSASVDAATNTVSFFVPYSKLGNPPANAPAHNVFASAFVGLIVDAAPGTPVAQDIEARPRFGAPYTVNVQDDVDPTTSPSPTASPTTSSTTSPSPSPSPSTSTTPPPPPGGRGTYPPTPNDPFFGTDPTNSVDLDPTQWALRKVRAPQAWQEKQATGFGIKVAVIDSGVDLEHEDLQCPGKLETVPGSNYIDPNKSSDDDNGHGTHVAGIIGACTNNNKGVAGVAPDATIVPFKVLDAAGDGNLNNAAAAVRKATDSGVDVINMSLGSVLGPASGIRQPVKALTFMDEAVAYAQSKGVVVIAAAGNDSGPLCEYPSAIEGVLCVGATDPRDLKSWYSVFPNKVDGTAPGPAVVAPGGTGQVFCDLVAEDVLSTYATDVDEAAGDCDGRLGYTALNGTSMASPHVAGAAALVYDRLGGVRTPENAQAVIDAIVDSADDLGAPGYDPAFGFGRLNALAAVRAVEPVIIPTEEASTLEITSSPEAGQYSDEAAFAVRLTDAAGEAIEGAEITFELSGGGGTATSAATTAADGTASHTFELNLAPGSYQLTVRYGGVKDVYKPSADVAPFVIQKEDTVTTLVVEGTGNNKVARATLTDADSAAGLEGQTITFTADGKVIGTGVTDATGTATLNVPKGAKKPSGKYEYVATFGGNDNYSGSSKSTQQ